MHQNCGNINAFCKFQCRNKNCISCTIFNIYLFLFLCWHFKYHSLQTLPKIRGKCRGQYSEYVFVHHLDPLPHHWTIPPLNYFHALSIKRSCWTFKNANDEKIAKSKFAKVRFLKEYFMHIALNWCSDGFLELYFIFFYLHRKNVIFHTKNTLYTESVHLWKTCMQVAKNHSLCFIMIEKNK